MTHVWIDIEGTTQEQAERAAAAHGRMRAYADRESLEFEDTSATPAPRPQLPKHGRVRLGNPRRQP
jgi:hypothetical protein